ncbi:MAG: TorF family putative porin [Sphingomicrobium sp.]
MPHWRRQRAPVTVPAVQRTSRAGVDKALQPVTVQSVVFAATLALASPAAAQAAASVSIFTDNRFRGYSLSDDRPVGIFDLSYDAPRGVYGTVSASIVATRSNGLQPLGLQLNGGYAKRLSSGLTVDLGIVHSDYSGYSSRDRRKSYTEAYAGVGGKLLSSRIYVSRGYLKPNAWTLYGEVDANVPAGTRLRVTGRVGMLVPLELRGGGETYRPEFDWRLGIARDLGPITINAAWTGRGRGRDPIRQRSYGRSALIFGVTYVL